MEGEREVAHANICSWAFGFVLYAAGLDERAWIPTHPISINLAMLEAAHRATMPLGQSMPSRLAPHIHTYTHTCLQIKCCCVELFVTTRALFFCLVAYINH